MNISGRIKFSEKSVASPAFGGLKSSFGGDSAFANRVSRDVNVLLPIGGRGIYDFSSRTAEVSSPLAGSAPIKTSDKRVAISASRGLIGVFGGYYFVSVIAFGVAAYSKVSGRIEGYAVGSVESLAAVVGAPFFYAVFRKFSGKGVEIASF